MIGRRGQRRSLRDYAFDFTIVVVGVFLGLQAQNWAMHRADRAQEARYLERIGADFDAITEEAQSCLSVHQGVGDAISRVRTALDAIRTGDAASPGFRADLITLSASRAPPGRSAAFVEMVSSGELGLLRSEPLSDALVRYDEQAVQNREYWRSIRDVSAPLLPVLYAHVELQPGDDIRTVNIIGADAARIAQDDAFEQYLNVTLAGASNLAQLCDFQLQEAEQVLERLANGD